MELKNKIVSIDIETVRLVESYDDLSEQGKSAWEYKHRHQNKIPDYEELCSLWESVASLYAEFSRVVAVGIAYEVEDEIRCKTLSNNDERELLKSLSLIINPFTENGYTLAAHSGKYFDFPYLAKRFTINRLDVPSCLDNFGSKPWLVPLVDTNELWKFGGTGPGSSLTALCFALGIDTPKEEMDGSEVNVEYFKGNLSGIEKYAGYDSIQTLNIIRVFRGQEPIPLHDAIYSEPEVKEENIFTKIFNSNRFPTKKLTEALSELDCLDGVDELLRAAYIKKDDKVADKKKKEKEINEFLNSL